jgi:hypothetical protein
MRMLALDPPNVSVSRLTEAQRFFQDGVEHWREIAGGGVDYPQHLGGRGLLFQRLVTFRGALFQLSLGIVSLSSAQSKLVPEIGNDLLRIVQRAVTYQAHLRTSSGPTFRADHSVIDTGHP